MEKLKRINNNHIVIIKEEKNKIIYNFYSYESLIATYTKGFDDLKLTKDWCYSRTTTKYFYEFINKYVDMSIKLKDGCVYSLFYVLNNATNKKDLINYLIDTKQIKMI